MEKAFDRVQHPFMIKKKVNSIGVEYTYFNIIKLQPIYLMDKNKKLSHYDQEQDKDVRFHHFYST